MLQRETLARWELALYIQVKLIAALIQRREIDQYASQGSQVSC
jgi:hypothetical protein